jgi:hypothetical protein
VAQRVYSAVPIEGASVAAIVGKLPDSSTSIGRWLERARPAFGLEGSAGFGFTPEHRIHYLGKVRKPGEGLQSRVAAQGRGAPFQRIPNQRRDLLKARACL